MIKNFLVTGPPKSGKSTLLTEVIEELKRRGFTVGGMSCPEILRGGRRWGFAIIDLTTGRRGILASVGIRSGIRVSKYGVNITDLEEIGVAAIEKAIEKSDIVVIDEIGKMELISKRFEQAVKRALDSQKPVIGVIADKPVHPFVVEVKQRHDVRVYRLTRNTPQSVRKRIADEIIKGVLNVISRNRTL